MSSLLEQFVEVWAEFGLVRQALGATAGCLECKLLKLNQERAALDSEYAKLPVTAGRTILQRRRKAEVEDRLSRIQLESSAIRLRLKAMDIK